MEHRFVQSGDTTIAYQERGSGEPLVLLMGFGADGSVWEKHAAVYEQHFHCIIPDNRGVGRSGQPKGPYTTAQMARDTIAVMDHAGVDRARVAGISMGGAIAQELVLLFPNRVQSLALISTWPAFNGYAAAVYENLKHVRTELSPSYFTELLQLWIFAPPYYEQHAEALQRDADAASNDTNPQSRNGFEAQLDACIHHNTVDRLHQIQLPVLITVGEMDIFTPPAFSELLHQQIKGSQLSRYPTGGHVHHWEDLDRFNHETLQFFLNN